MNRTEILNEFEIFFDASGQTKEDKATNLEDLKQMDADQLNKQFNAFFN